MDDFNKSYMEELMRLDDELISKQEALELEYQAKRTEIINRYESMRNSNT